MKPMYAAKAWVAAVVAGLAVLLQYGDVLPLWVVIAAGVVIAGLATYQTPNDYGNEEPAAQPRPDLD